jgi:hypothetical protein
LIPLNWPQRWAGLLEKVKFLWRLQGIVHPVALSLYKLRCTGHAIVHPIALSLYKLRCTGHAIIHPIALSLYKLHCTGHATDPAFAKNCFLLKANPLSADCYCAECIILQGFKIFRLGISEEVCSQQLPIPPSRDLTQCIMRYFRRY